MKPLASALANLLLPVPSTAMSYARLVAAQIRRSLMEGDDHMIHEAKGLKVDQHQSNACWGVHQLRVVLPDNMGTYRVIVAPADAPVMIGNCSADEHFIEPLIARAAQ